MSGCRRYGFLVGIAAALWTLWAAQRRDTIDPVRFEDTLKESGIRFVVRNSATPRRHQIETMIAGVAVFDYNNDHKPDIYFVNGANIPQLKKTSPEYYNRLYRNNGNGAFTDVTELAGVAGEGYGMGVAAGDYDNDGFADLFLPGLNRNILYRNRGDGTFEDVTRKANLEGIDPDLGKTWAIAAGWFDYDRDGLLDLFVVNYCVWDPEREPFCGDAKAGYSTYCDPRLYRGLPNFLYHNNGDGTFSDVSKTSGVAAHVGKGMGVVFADYDQDGDPDVFVANDTETNFLFRNDGGGKFKEVALQAGVAYNDDGRVLSSMGADFRDYDNDGHDDLFVSALANETFPLFRNLGHGFFNEVTQGSLLGKASLSASGWSAGMFDFNNDGYKDLLVAGGDVQDNTELFSSRKAKQTNLLLVNLKNGTFGDRTREAGDALRQEALHRGAAFGDLDSDGRVDAVITRLNDRIELLRNISPSANHWLALRLTGRRSNRDALGARIRVVSASGLQQWNHVTTSTGFACSSAKTVHFGLGRDAVAKLIEIRWLNGVTQRLEEVKADRYVDIEEPLDAGPKAAFSAK